MWTQWETQLNGSTTRPLPNTPQDEKCARQRVMSVHQLAINMVKSGRVEVRMPKGLVIWFHTWYECSSLADEAGAITVAASCQIVPLVLNSTPAACQTMLGAAQNVRHATGSLQDLQTRFLRFHTLWLAKQCEGQLSRSG